MPSLRRPNLSSIWYTLHPHLHGLWGVFTAEFSRRISTSMVGLFIPIYIWQETGNVLSIAHYYILYSITALIILYPAAKLIKFVGVDWGMGIGSILRALFIFTLIFAKDNHLFFWISAITYGAAQPFDWLPFNYVVAKLSKNHKKFGRSSSLASMTTRFASALGPVIGGLIIFEFGYNILYLVSGSFMVFAFLSPFFDDFEKRGMHVSFADVIKIAKDPGIIKHIFIFLIRFWNDWIYVIIWPLFLYNFVGSITSSGILQTLSLLLALIISYVVGKLVDRNNFKTIQPGVLMVAISWWLRIISKFSFGVFLSDTAYNIGNTLVWNPHEALLIKRSLKKYTMEFYLVKDLMIHGISVISTIVIFLMLLHNFSYQTIFFISGSVSLMALFLPKFYAKYILLFKK